MFGKQIKKCLAFHSDLALWMEVIPYSKTDSITQFRRNLHSQIETHRFKQYRQSKQTINTL